MKENGLKTIIEELKNASKMHLRQSEELQDHANEMTVAPTKMNSPLKKKKKKNSCWKGYKAKGKKKSPSGKKTKGGKVKMVNNCVKK